MRLLLTLLFLLHITLSIAISFPVGAASAGEAAGDAAGDVAAGSNAAGRSASSGGSEGHIGADESTGCTIYSCPNDINGGTTHPEQPNSPPPPNDSNSQSSHSADEAIEKIHDVLDSIETILSLATSTSDSTTYTYTITSRPPLPTAAHPCLSAQSIYSACAAVQVYPNTPNFTDQVVSQQASCLCYRQFSGSGSASGSSATTTWVPGLFDGYVSSCNAFVATQTIVSVSASVTGGTSAVGLATGLCTSVGDVRAAASAGSTTRVSGAAATTTTTTGPSTSNTNTVVAVPATGVGTVGRKRVMGLGYGGMLLSVVLGVVI